MSWKILLSLIIIYFVLLVAGGLVFHYIETVPEEEYEKVVDESKQRIRELVDEYGCPMTEEKLTAIIADILDLYDSGNFSLTNKTGSNWDIPNSMFFAATLATTIGYGNQAPVHPYGRAFCVFYAFFSIPVCLVMLGGVGHSITQCFNKLDNKVKDRMDKCNNPRAEKISKSIRSLTTLFLGMGLFLFLPAGAFAYMENWTYQDSLYYVFITLTTVGLGDMVAGTGTGQYEDRDTKTGYQLSVALWIIFGLAWLSTVIAMASDFFQSLVDKVDDEVMAKMKNFVDKVDGVVLSPLAQKVDNVVLIPVRIRDTVDRKLSNFQDKLDKLNVMPGNGGAEVASDTDPDSPDATRELIGKSDDLKDLPSDQHNDSIRSHEEGRDADVKLSKKNKKKKGNKIDQYSIDNEAEQPV